MNKIITLLGGRKFILAVSLLIIGIILQCLGKFDSNMSMFFLGLLGAFSAGNALEGVLRNR